MTNKLPSALPQLYQAWSVLEWIAWVITLRLVREENCEEIGVEACLFAHTLCAFLQLCCSVVLPTTPPCYAGYWMNTMLHLIISTLFPANPLNHCLSPWFFHLFDWSVLWCRLWWLNSPTPTLTHRWTQIFGSQWQKVFE